MSRKPACGAGATQAIAAEARTLAHPVSCELVSSSKAEGIEDRTTMAPLGPVPRLRGVRPVELIRAVALTWQSAGLRSNEIARCGPCAFAGSTKACQFPVTPPTSCPSAVCPPGMPNPQDRPAFTEPAGPLRRAGRLVCFACTSYGRSVSHYELLAAQERLPGRPFTDPERTLADARVMGRMLQRLRLEARSWPGWRTSVELLDHTRAGCRHWLVVPCTPALRGAQDVTVVGFFGDLRGGMDHSAVYDLEADVVARLGRYAPAGLLSYYDAEIARGLHGNLVLFGTREVPCEWHGDVVHARAVALAPSHYRCLRLHRGIIRGALLGQGKLVIKRTRYFDFGRQPAWRGLRRFE